MKPIGNLVANLRVDDKVSYRIKEKFASKTLLPSTPQAPQAAASSKKVVKYKSRKK